jgi:EmrB/QacA subfamily drug resistance transporter
MVAAADRPTHERSRQVTSPNTGHPRRWIILLVLILGLFGIAMDNTVLVVALPVLSRDLRADTSQLQWMIDAYTLVFAGLLLMSGALSDRFGRRRLLVIGLSLFGLGSALAPLVGSADALIALRAFMGLGASLAMPPTLSIIADVFPENERPKAIAVWSGVTALGIVAGPILGGFLLEHFAWPSVFVVNVPVVLVGVAATLWIVPESRAPGRIPMDPVGAVLSVVALVALTYGIIEEPGFGWADPRIYGSLGAALIFGAVFIVWEHRSEFPMVEIGLFRNPRFAAACISVTLSFFALNGALFMVTLYLQEVRGLSPLETGYRFLAIAAGIVVASPIAAKLTTRYGAKLATTAGLLLIALGMGLVTTIGVSSGDAQIVAVLFVAAAGIGMAMTPATDAIMGAVPPEKFGVGSALNDTTREIGGAFGIAILGSIFQAAYADRVGGAAALLPPDAAHAVRDSFAGAAAVAGQLGGSAGSGLLDAARNAFVGAMGWTSITGVAFAVAGVVVAAAFLPARSGGKGTPAVDHLMSEEVAAEASGS